jgi:hypothetical protein
MRISPVKLAGMYSPGRKRTAPDGSGLGEVGECGFGKSNESGGFPEADSTLLPIKHVPLNHDVCTPPLHAHLI